MNASKRGISVILRFFLAFIALLFAYVASSLVVGDLGIEMTPEQEAAAGRALIAVAIAISVVLSCLVMNTRMSGLRLVGAVFLVHFGVETFMTQIETLYFNQAVQMESGVLTGIALGGAIRALLFAPLIVAVFGKFKAAPESLTVRRNLAGRELGKRVLAVAVLYAIVYFLFGYFVAWQSADVRVYYSGTAAIKPFFIHFSDLLFSEDPLLLPFQLFRGLLWAGLTLLIVNMLDVRRWHAALLAALVYSVLMTVPLALFPNPYMPPGVATAHSWEVGSSMFLFGAVSGWLLRRRDDVTNY